MIRKCMECDWYTVIETAQGRHIGICADENGGSFLQETGLLGWCGEETENEGIILTIPEDVLDRYRRLMQAKTLSLKELGYPKYAVIDSWSVSFGDGYEVVLNVCSSDESDPLWCQAGLFRHGDEFACTEAEDDLLRDWSLVSGERQFVVRVAEGTYGEA